MPLISITFLKMSEVKVGNESMSFITLNLLSHNYCKVGVMELCLLGLLMLIDWFCLILTIVYSLRACNMWLTRNRMFIREIWGKFTSFAFWDFQISLVWHGRFHNFKKMNSVNLSQVSLLNIWLLVQI